MADLLVLGQQHRLAVPQRSRDDLVVLLLGKALQLSRDGTPTSRTNRGLVLECRFRVNPHAQIVTDYLTKSEAIPTSVKPSNPHRSARQPRSLRGNPQHGASFCGKISVHEQQFY